MTKKLTITFSDENHDELERLAKIEGLDGVPAFVEDAIALAKYRTKARLEDPPGTLLVGWPNGKTHEVGRIS